MTISLKSFAAAAVLTAFSLPALAETWDMSLPWPDGNFHTKNARTFVDAVSEATEGRVTINVHPGGSLGFSGPEMLGAVRDGLVPIGDVYLSQQVGEAPLLGIESIPFLVNSYEELKELHKYFRPVVEEIAAANNQKVLYMVPWPAPGIFTSVDAKSLDDLAGIKIRTYNATTTELFNAIGMTAVQLPWGEVVPSLAAGTIDGVTTSASSGVDGAFWEFLDFFYPTGHVWSSDAITVNLDSWAALSEADQNAILKVAAELEPTFWQVSADEDAAKMATLAENGLATAEVSEDMINAMRAATANMIEEFLAETPEAKPVLDEFFAASGRN
ncbi:TRAP transporter substrate-binding protein [Roseibium sp. MMSF_3544]|uniref:TRAP transporter substrate-binding protein n=1 Tax=unclassified Roseibium TaxID=2629323 RepID=UPI00273FAA9D|nr:TRAP transporter substrate-binding protein [Roseibium sp. MMSF_3544]